MKYYSTNHKSPSVSLKEAVLNGLADDGGLYMPEKIPALSKDFFSNISGKSFQEISFIVADALLENDIPKNILRKIVDQAINFDAPLISINDEVNVLELFHGPTLAFKDFGARFMAGLMSYFVSQSDKQLNILVATSGDTGSAVASGFYEVPNIRVFILYPSGKVSDIQEKQLTTWGKNITAIEVDGTFDDCQRMVKHAFGDVQIKNKLLLTSANSINIARLIPQSFYYFHAYAQLKDKTRSTIFSVPSGNFGNITGGLLAAKMGLPVSKFIASTNINDVVPQYLHTGKFNARLSKATISNAMDVGNPSNFTRMNDLMPQLIGMQAAIEGYSFTDDQTRTTINDVYAKSHYILDPHGAVGYLGLMEYKRKSKQKINGIFLETAHPAKFRETVESAIGIKIPIPENLKRCIEKEKKTIRISHNFEKLKEFLSDF